MIIAVWWCQKHKTCTCYCKMLSSFWCTPVQVYTANAICFKQSQDRKWHNSLHFHISTINYNRTKSLVGYSVDMPAISKVLICLLPMVSFTDLNLAAAVLALLSLTMMVMGSICIAMSLSKGVNFFLKPASFCFILSGRISLWSGIKMTTIQNYGNIPKTWPANMISVCC